MIQPLFIIAFIVFLFGFGGFFMVAEQKARIEYKDGWYRLKNSLGTIDKSKSLALLKERNIHHLYKTD
jgi:hypothetical protein